MWIYGATASSFPPLRFIEDFFPLIVTISSDNFEASDVKIMSEGFEEYFRRGERYSVLVVTPRNAPAPGQLERRMIADWANHPRVRDFSKRLCVGTATVLSSPLTRAAFSIIMAFGRPPSPLECFADIEQGLDYCLGRIHAEGLATSKPLDLIRYEVLKALSDLA